MVKTAHIVDSYVEVGERLPAPVEGTNKKCVMSIKILKIWVDYTTKGV